MPRPEAHEDALFLYRSEAVSGGSHLRNLQGVSIARKLREKGLGPEGLLDVCVSHMRVLRQRCEIPSDPPLG